MLLNELFDNNDTSGIEYSPGADLAHVTIGDDTYDVKLMKLTRKGFSGVSISFTLDGSFSDTNKHIALKLLNKVFIIVRLVIEKESPDFITFQSSGKRGNIYNKFIKKIPNKGIHQIPSAGETVVIFNKEASVIVEPEKKNDSSIKDKINDSIDNIVSILNDMDEAVSSGTIKNVQKAEKIKEISIDKVGKWETKMSFDGADTTAILKDTVLFIKNLNKHISRIS